MNARAYRHHTGISRMMVVNGVATLATIALLAYADAA